MKTIALTLFAAALGFAQSSSSAAATPAPTSASQAEPAAQSKKPAQAAKPAPGKPEGPAQTIPASAKQVEPHLYRFTDSNGKTWNYRQTPFGISKWEETSAPAPQASGQPAPQPASQATQVHSDPVVVTDLGDSYRFEKKTPFGQSTWVHKKTELTDEEKAWAAGQQSQADPARTGVNTKPARNQ